MVRQAVRQTYTYYSPDEPKGEVVEDAPLAGHGKAWVLGKYIHPVYPSPLNVRVGDAGIHVWMVINWLRLCDDDVETLLKRYPETVTLDDVEVARWYYESNKDLIDREISDQTE